MVYLLFEILGSLIITAAVAFALGWYLRGLRDNKNSSSLLNQSDDTRSDLTHSDSEN